MTFVRVWGEDQTPGLVCLGLEPVLRGPWFQLQGPTQRLLVGRRATSRALLCWAPSRQAPCPGSPRRRHPGWGWSAYVLVFDSELPRMPRELAMSYSCSKDYMDPLARTWMKSKSSISP